MPRLVVVLAAAAALLIAAPAALAEPPAPESLDGSSWQLHHDPDNHGLAAGWDAGGPNAGWEKASVPSTVEAEPLARFFKGTVAWYRLRFQAPPASPGYSWALRFDQVRRKSEVWLNGQRLGSHGDPYTPVQLPA